MHHPLSHRSRLAALLLAGFQVAWSQSTIDLNKTYQTIDGFGGMNFPRWQPGLNDSNGVNMAEKAFGTAPGDLGLSILRINLGIDTTWWNTELFACKVAQAHGVKIFTSEWSTPLEMKDGGKLVGGHLKTSSYADYAAFTNRFIDFMKRNGVDIYAASVANEPDCPVMYETTEWTASEVTNFVKQQGANIKAKLMAAETFQFNKSYSDMILNDAAAAANLDIVAAHPYGISSIASVMSYPKAAQMGKALWMTEHYTTTSGSNPQQANLWPDALEAGKEVHAFMVINYNAYVWWYIRRNYGLITDDGKVSKRGFAFSHFSRFVRPGYQRVDVPASPASGILATAYKKEGSVVVVLINSNNSTSNLSFNLSNVTGTIPSFRKYVTSSSKSQAEDATAVTVTGNKSFSVSLDAQSITTLIYEPVSTRSVPEGALSLDSPIASGEYQVYDPKGVLLGRIQHPGGSVEASLRSLPVSSSTVVLRSAHGDRSMHTVSSVK